MPKLCPACKDYPLQNPAFILEAWQPSKMSEELDDHDVNGQEKVWNKAYHGLSIDWHQEVSILLWSWLAWRHTLHVWHWFTDWLAGCLTNWRIQSVRFFIFFGAWLLKWEKHTSEATPYQDVTKDAPVSRPQVAKSIVFNSQNSADYAAKWVGRPVFVVLMSSLKNKNG